MHDIKSIRADPGAFDAALARRGVVSASAAVLAADARLRAVQTEVQAALAKRNEASRAIGQAKAKKDEAAAAALMAEVAVLKDRIPGLEADDRVAAAALDAVLETLPNLPA
ncbi:MAG: serine--tRNA ligase, partial [Sandarakinorhabdus sp.]|nr:serine--tRNA ligase [Sandarakinorhabdus sp.]